MQFPPAASFSRAHSPFLMSIFFVMDGVMQSWPVAILMRVKKLSGLLSPNRILVKQQAAHTQRCTHKLFSLS